MNNGNAWKQLKDFDIKVKTGTGQEFTVTLRVTKNSGYRPLYSWCMGSRNDPQPFRTHLHPAILEPAVAAVFLPAFAKTMAMLEECIRQDREATEAMNEKIEQDRRAAIAGHGASKNPNANRGLNATGKTAKKRARELGSRGDAKKEAQTG